MTTGERIKRRREELGMTQDELAKKLGYKSRTSVVKMESNAGGIRQHKIIEIAEILGLKPIDLIDKPDNFEARAISYQTFLDNSPTMYELNDIVKKNADNPKFIDHLLEYAKALDLLYEKESMDKWLKEKEAKKHTNHE